MQKVIKSEDKILWFTFWNKIQAKENVEIVSLEVFNIS
jgi:hypothetical protein